MKRAKLYLASLSLILTIGSSVILGGMASAATVFPLPDIPVPKLLCGVSDTEIQIDAIPTCDLSIDKQVSINGGSYVDADTSDASASAYIGDTVTWKITVTNKSINNGLPYGTVYIKDVLPTGVTYAGTNTASSGTYTGNDGSPNANTWVLPLFRGKDISTFTLPATLVITTVATTTGLAQNTATFQDYNADNCDGPCDPVSYFDADSSNNTNDAWVNIQTKPQVLGASTVTPTLTNTGSNLIESVVAGLFILTTVLVTAYSRFARKPAQYKIKTD